MLNKPLNNVVQEGVYNYILYIGQYDGRTHHKIHEDEYIKNAKSIVWLGK